MPCPTKEGLVERTPALEISECMSIASLFEGGLVKSRLDADLEDEWEVFALKGSRLDPRVGQPGDEEVPQVERQLGDHSKSANHVDQKPTILRLATEATHFQRLYPVNDGFVVGPQVVSTTSPLLICYNVGFSLMNESRIIGRHQRLLWFGKSLVPNFGQKVSTHR